MIKIEIAVGTSLEPEIAEVADLAELILEAARERLDVPHGETFGLEDIERAGLLGSESSGLLREPQCPGRGAFEASLMRESIRSFF